MRRSTGTLSDDRRNAFGESVRSGLEDCRVRADDVEVAAKHRKSGFCGIMWRNTRGGLAVRRLNLRREDGVAMTEFALIVPVFMVIVVGLLCVRTSPLLLDRDEPRGERGGPLGRRRSQPIPGIVSAAGGSDRRDRLPVAAAARGKRIDRRVSKWHERMHRLPGRWNPRHRKASARQDGESRSLSSPSSISARSRSAVPRRNGSSASTTAFRPCTTTTPPTISGHARDRAGVSSAPTEASRRAGRSPCTLGGHDPGLSSALGARRGRGQLVHAQATAAEQG